MIPSTHQAIRLTHAYFRVAKGAQVTERRPGSGGGEITIRSCVQGGTCELEAIDVVVEGCANPDWTRGEDGVCRSDRGSGSGGTGGWGGGDWGGGGGDGYDPDDEPPPGITDAEWQSLNPTEKEMCRANPGECWNVMRASSHAREWAAAESAEGAHNGLQDALRHAMWNADMTKRMGADRAQAWADAHELYSTSPRETRMDLWNNQWGRWVGNNYGNTAVGVRFLRDNGKLCLSPQHPCAQG